MICNRMLMLLYRNTPCLKNLSKCCAKNYSSQKGNELKKFYAQSFISKAEDGYEVNLDKFKLKTPMGNLFKVPTETLALAVSTEWNSQQAVIKRHTMSMTALCNMAIDNPTGRSKDAVVAGILEMLDTDTICYRLEEPEELSELQKKNWDPWLHWFHERYGVTLEVTTGIGVPLIPSSCKEVLRQHLNSYNNWALVGYQQAVESVKSFILATAAVDQALSVEKAVQLARLETDYQTSLWGDVEWHHGIDRLELNTRLAAAVLFVRVNSGDLATTFSKAAASKLI